MGAARFAGAPGLDGQLRRDLPRPGPADVGRPGILHSEKNGSASERVHFVQMWVVPDESGVDPGYQQVEIDDELLPGGLVTIASGMHDDAAITIRNRYAALHGARLQPGDSVELPQAPYLHLFVPRGEVTLEGAGRCTKVTRCGSPRRAASASPPSSRRRSWSGRCMRVWLPRNGLASRSSVVVLAACSTDSPPQPSPSRPRAYDAAGCPGVAK